MNLYLQCIWQVFLFKAYCNFKGTLAAIHLSCTVIILGGQFQWYSIFVGTISVWNQYLIPSLFSKILGQFASSCSYSFGEWPFFQIYCMFQNRRNCSKEIWYLSTMVPPWFQGCINWKIGCYLRTPIPAINLFYGSFIISREHLKRPIM